MNEEAVFVDNAWEVHQKPVPVTENILTAPTTLFGGPSIKEVFYGNG
jgi:hypothetical protein